MYCYIYAKMKDNDHVDGVVTGIEQFSGVYEGTKWLKERVVRMKLSGRKGEEVSESIERGELFVRDAITELRRHPHFGQRIDEKPRDYISRIRRQIHGVMVRPVSESFSDTTLYMQKVLDRRRDLLVAANHEKVQGQYT